MSDDRLLPWLPPTQGRQMSGGELKVVKNDELTPKPPPNSSEKAKNDED